MELVFAPLAVLVAVKLAVGLDSLDFLHIGLLQLVAMLCLRLHQLAPQARREPPPAKKPKGAEAAEAPLAVLPRMAPTHPLAERARGCVDSFLRQYAPADRVAGGGADPHLLGSAQWPLFLETAQGAVHRNLSEKLCFRLSQRLQTSPAGLLALMTDTDRRTSWDRTCESVEIAERLDARTYVVYYKTKGKWPTWPRDLVMLSHTAPLLSPSGEPAGYVRVNCSMTHPAWGDQYGCVRAHCELAGELMLAVPGRPGECDLVMIQNVDPRGSLPESIVKFALKESMASTQRRLSGLAPELVAPELGEDLLPSSPSAPALAPPAGNVRRALAKRESRWDKVVKALKSGSPLAALTALVLLVALLRRRRR